MLRRVLAGSLALDVEDPGDGPCGFRGRPSFWVCSRRRYSRCSARIVSIDHAQRSQHVHDAGGAAVEVFRHRCASRCAIVDRTRRRRATPMPRENRDRLGRVAAARSPESVRHARIVPNADRAASAPSSRSFRCLINPVAQVQSCELDRRRMIDVERFENQS